MDVNVESTRRESTRMEDMLDTLFVFTLMLLDRWIDFMR
jgi:hypothetical protein